MLNRTVPLVVCLSIFSGAAFAQNPQGVGYAVEFASSAGASGQFQAFLYNTTSLSSTVFSNTGPAGPNQILAKPDGSKFYITGTTGLETFDPNFGTPKIINGVPGTPIQEVMSPDGRFLLMAVTQSGGGSNVYVLNTTSDTVLLNQSVSGAVIGVLVSHDSKTAWILSSSSGVCSITTLNLVSQQQVGIPIFLRDPQSGATLGGNPQAFSLSPLGLLYVSAGNAILEIDPVALANCQTSPLTCAPVTSNISINATAGPLQFTPDGSQAYFINLTPPSEGGSGGSLLRLSLPNHAVASWPPFVAGQTVEQFDSIIVASSTRIFGHTPGDTTLWDIAPDLSAVNTTTLSSVLPAANVLSIVASHELPAARYLFALIGGGAQQTVYRVDLSSNTVTSQVAAALGQGTLAFVYVPQEANPASFIPFNATQTVAAGTTAAPLIARVVDVNGNPVFNVPVAFTGDTSLTFTNASTATNGDGYAQATVTMGQTPGQYPVTLTAGTGTNAVTTTFSLTIPGGTTGGGNGNQVIIISGNGQLFQAANNHFAPPTGYDWSLLAVQVLDTNGNPLANQPVTFQVDPTSPAEIGTILDPNTTTDNNGMASTNFTPGLPPQNYPFYTTNVYANTPVGSVTFVETVFQTDQNGFGAPTVKVIQPDNTVPIPVGEGDVIPQAIIAAIFTGSFGGGSPVPNIGVRIADPTDSTQPGPGTCQGNPLSDQTGSVHCNFVAACATSIVPSTMQPLGLGLHSFTIVTGEWDLKSGYVINLLPGSTQTVTKGSPGNTTGGDGQTGKPGTALTTPLIVTVSDKCGTATQGVPVTFKVTQGSATLSTTTVFSNQGGQASTKVTLGQNPGTVIITASINSTTAVTFTENTQALVGALTLLSGGGQTALANTAFSQPLVFQLTDTSHNPISGFTVNFSVVGGTASLSAASGTTNAQGQAAVTVTAGNAAGTVTISATYTTFTAPATLTVVFPGPNIISIVNGASGVPGLVPCGFAIASGTGLVPNPGVALGNILGIGPLPLSFSGVSISVGLLPAPIYYVANQGGVQTVAFQTPCEVPAGNATVVITLNSAPTNVPNVTVYPAQPGIFTSTVGAINYGYVADSTGNPITTTNLAHAGQTYYMYATGMGQTTPPATTNVRGNGTQFIPASSVALAINGVGVNVGSVQYIQGELFEYLITFTIPTLVNGQPFPTGTNLPISLGVIVNNQTLYDTAQVALAGIH